MLCTPVCTGRADLYDLLCPVNSGLRLLRTQCTGGGNDFDPRQDDWGLGFLRMQCASGGDDRLDLSRVN